MAQIMLFLVSCLLAAALLAPEAAGVCNACNENGVACISETSFHLCYRGALDSSQTFNCPDGQVCTGEIERCGVVAEAAACHASKACGACDGSKMFTCTSRTTFAQCNGTVLLTDVTSACPPGLVCDSSQAGLCVPELRVMGMDAECAN